SGGVAGTAPLTGLALLPLLLAMLLGSCPCLRRRGHFQVFYWTHLSYIPVWFLLLLHAPHFWKWFLIPGSLFFLEKVLGWLWRRAGDLHILEARLLPSKVTHLVIQRPESFRFQPGDFVFLNIPAIAAYEWHPFSISSAPEQPGTLWLHIRARGQWTNKLYEHFQRLESRGPEPDPPGKSRRERWEQVGSSGSHGIIPVCSRGTPRDGHSQPQIPGSGDPSGDSRSLFPGRIRGLRQGRSRGAAGVPSLRSRFPGKGPGAGGLRAQRDPAELQRQGETFLPFLDPRKRPGSSIPSIPATFQALHPCSLHPSHIPSSSILHPCAQMIPPGADPSPALLENSPPFLARIPNSVIPSVPFCSTWELLQHLELRDLSRVRICPGSVLGRDLSSFRISPCSGSLQCFLDGPYGSPSWRIFTSEHAVLIGAGIGITPFASILQSIMFRYRRRMRSCPSCRFSWREEERDEEMTLRKVDFVWITREQQHLQWFLSLLAQLEAQQAELEPGGKFLELHLFMTSALGKGDVKALGLQLALDLLAAQEKRDSISGLRSRTQPGHPDWDKLFGKVAAERRGKVRVFFCGSAGLARIIRRHCRSFGFAFSKENF
ncbi:NADPH oxidase 5, partial [Cyanistes caeruleus]|uniref:NADPH oxidase 5 n=1 Tax=Cyanistes caeruleus TaxID=156563 RepID=UPI000CDAC3CC